MTKWKTEHHFTSWLGLAPNTKISGGKIISSRIKRKRKYAGQAYRMEPIVYGKVKVPWATIIAGYEREPVPLKQLLQRHGNL